MARLDGKVAIITGGANGMGESHARLFIEEGAKVAIKDIDETKGQQLAEELGERAIFIKHDVSRDADWQRMVEETEAAFGPINVLVNNAGVATVLSAEHSSLEDYLRIVNINQISVFLGIH